MNYAEKKALLPHPDRKNVCMRPTEDTPEERIRAIAKAVAVIAETLELPQTADRMRKIANDEGMSGHGE